MTDQAIDILLGLEVETRILPAITGMASHAVLLVGNGGRAVVVDDVFLAQLLAGFWIGIFPGPVLCMLNLLGRFGVATQAGLGHLRS